MLHLQRSVFCVRSHVALVALAAECILCQALNTMGNFFLATSGETRIQLYVSFLKAADASVRYAGA